MQDLRIVGVDAEGPNPRLLLSDEAGTEYSVPIDDALRAAAARQAPHSRVPVQSAPLTPRDIQAKLRGGATLDEVVRASGLSREHVLRYAGPVADERAYISSRARQSVVARASSAEHHRLAFGDESATLEAMVRVRLRAIGVSLPTVSWDAWRREDGTWVVICDFDAETSQAQAGGIGQQPPAEWFFDPKARSVVPANKWAESLSELPATPREGHRAGRRLAAVDEPFDVDDASDSRSQSDAGSSPGSGTDHEGLLEILRARRGQRLGTDETGDDKLATLLTREEQPPQDKPAPLRPVEDGDSGDGESGPADEQHTDALPGLEGDLGAPAQQDPEAGTDAWGFSYEDSGDDGSSTEDGEEAQQGEPQEKQSAKSKKKSSRRPAMPRWDDILFGSKND